MVVSHMSAFVSFGCGDDMLRHEASRKRSLACIQIRTALKMLAIAYKHPHALQHAQSGNASTVHPYMLMHIVVPMCSPHHRLDGAYWIRTTT